MRHISPYFLRTILSLKRFARRRKHLLVSRWIYPFHKHPSDLLLLFLARPSPIDRLTKTANNICLVESVVVPLATYCVMVRKECRPETLLVPAFILSMTLTEGSAGPIEGLICLIPYQLSSRLSGILCYSPDSASEALRSVSLSLQKSVIIPGDHIY
jgi:hypothetical protein